MSVTHFVVTGFGPFTGVTANPTQVLVEWLEQQDCAALSPATSPQRPCSNAAEQHGSYKILSCTVLEVSADAVNAYLEKQAALLQEACSKVNKQPVVLLHLGVDTQRNGLNLELQAYNNATFRCPDQAGWQPSGLVIERGVDLGLNSIRCTALPLEQVAQELQAAGFDCHVSQDAGRFVCNYIYHKSLQLTAGLQHNQQRAQAQPVTAANTTAAAAAQQHTNSSSSSSTCLKDIRADKQEGSSNGGSNGDSDDSSTGYGAAAAVGTAAAITTAADACVDNPVYSLFVHVPPFTCIPQERQCEFLAALLQAISNWVNSR